MQLSRLEIKGFKSFGDKVVLNFDDGITGIVGPNGCGKSNIVDAIRWVLGEQKTRALRSEKMENVIFNGTKKRKPLQMAEVSLTFNNTKNVLPTEYSHITITRRYYRSGDSEYQLNGVTCRLKDITDLFLDTGIGSDSYAIIELKMVDDILNDKDNSRRNLFEEAAGISKFKIRKKQTLKKLDDTDKDLERVDDILFEIEKNLKSLERQAKQAEKYLKLKEDYKGFSIELAKISITKQKETFVKLNEQIQSENSRKTETTKEQAKSQAAIEASKAQMLQKEKLLGSRQKTLNEHINKIRQYESDKKIRSERLRFLSDKTNNLKDQISQDKTANERAYTEVKALNEEKLSAEKILHEIQQKVEIYQQEYDDQKAATTQLREELQVINNQHRAKQDEVFQLKKSLEINQVQHQTVVEELEKTSSDSTSHNDTIVELETNLKDLAGKLDKENKALEKLLNEEEQNRKNIKDAEGAIDKTKEALAGLNRDIDSKENEYNLTKSLVDNLEGFPEAIKFLKKNTHWNEETFLLSDVLTCPEEFRVAIENFLEPYMNYYVVEDATQAYQAVTLLKEASKGKANFFLLDSFEKFKPAKIQKFENCTPALDLVEYDSKYEKLIQYILNEVYVITNENENVPEGKSEIFISQSGKLTKRLHSVHGGSVGLFEGKRIGRAKNLEKLQEKIKSLSKKRDKVKVQLDREQNELLKHKNSDIKERIDLLKSTINKVNEQYIGTKLREEQLRSLITNNATKKEDLERNVKILEEGIAKSKPKLELQEVELQGLDDKISQRTSELTHQNELLSQKSNTFNQENIHSHQQQNRIQSIEQEIKYKESTVENTQIRITKNTEELKKTDEEIKAIHESSDTTDDDLLAMYDEKEAIEEGVNEAEKDYYASRGDIDELEESARAVQKQRENADSVLMDLQNRLSETKLSLSSVKERLKVEFNVNIDQLLISNDDEEVKDSGLSEEELEESVSKCKDKIDRIGPINPMAMEAYEEIQKRHEFIIGQKSDLSEAKSSLMKTIAEIDTVAKENFLKAFGEIHDNFINVFRSLFTEEDSCSLTLSDPDNPLESSIDISAKPKGKRPLGINQLSGGEKTLTAVALLFSIYLIKPAPFCIFDEVDAPLDDANIDKFNNIIRKFSADSQFILVTHNKRTMSTTDVIYGVTMQETGVSKLVPVDLRSLMDE